MFDWLFANAGPGQFTFAKEARALSVLASGRTFALSDIDSNNITAHTYSIFVEYQLIVEQNLVRTVACVCQ